LLCFLVTIVAGAAEPLNRVSTSLSITLQATADYVSGGHQGVSRRLVIPDGCDYVNHDVELLDGTSVHSRDGGSTSFKDEVVRDKGGRVTELSLTVGARRGDTRRSPPETIKARMAVRMQCNDEIAKAIDEGRGKDEQGHR
jgi:hypothetical protein